MSKRPYFPIYHDDMDSYSHLSDREMGKLLRLLYQTSLGEIPDVPRSLLSEYNAMAKRVQKDAEAYDKKVEQATRASHARRNKSSDDIGRYRTTSDELQLNSTQLNTTQHSTYTVHANDRDDDMSDVLMNM